MRSSPPWFATSTGRARPPEPVADHAVSSSPLVQAQLDRLASLSPGADVLGLERITRLLERVGNPERRLPPTFHVAGTNGKGSTCAFLRACLEAAGHRVLVYTSPHLVRFNERIRLAGTLIADDLLADLLREVLDAGGDVGASFFEVTTAAAFLAFARTPADACVIEVGLGGRLDATNVVNPLVTGIAGLGIDHEAFLLVPEAGTPDAPLARIAFEKAGIAKRGVPLVTQRYPEAAARAVADVAAHRGAPLHARGTTWGAEIDARLTYRDEQGVSVFARPALAGAYQADNAALAVAMLRRQHVVSVEEGAISRGLAAARWPARLQRLGSGPLTALLHPEQRAAGVWLDGAHNESAAAAIAGAWAGGEATALVIGMLANKDARGVLRQLITPATHVIAVPVRGHLHHSPEHLAATAREAGAASTATADDVSTAFTRIAAGALPVRSVLVAGSLYLAGAVLATNDEQPV